MGPARRPGPARRDRALRVRAEDRRPGDEHPLRGRPLRAGGDPWRRAGRRGRHGQRGDDRRRPRPAAAPKGTRARRARGARRGVPAGRQLRADERAGRGRRRAGCSSTRATPPPAACARRTPRSPPSATCRSGCTSSARSSAGRRSTRHTDSLEYLARARASRSTPRSRSFDSLDDVAAHCQHWEEHRHDLGYEIDGVVVKVDDVDQRERLGLDVAGAAVGDRLQVPARGAHDACCATSRCRSGAPGGRRRSPCSSRCSSAARPSAWRRCTTRTRCGPRTSGPGDTVIVRKAGDVIPEVVGPVLVDAPGRTPSRGRSRRRARARCGSTLVRLEGEADTRCVEPACPYQRDQRIIYFASRGAMDIEGLGERTVGQLTARRARRRRRRPLRARPTSSCSALEGFATDQRRQAARRDRRVAAPAAAAAAHRARHQAPRSGRGAGAGRPLRHARRGDGGVGGGAGRASRGSGRSSPSRSPRGSRSTSNRAFVEKLRARRRRLRRAPAGGAEGAAGARRQGGRRHRARSRATPARRPRRRSSPAAARARAASAPRRTPSSSATTPARAR